MLRACVRALVLVVRVGVTDAGTSPVHGQGSHHLRHVAVAPPEVQGVHAVPRGSVLRAEQYANAHTYMSIFLNPFHLSSSGGVIHHVLIQPQGVCKCGGGGRACPLEPEKSDRRVTFNSFGKASGPENRQLPSDGKRSAPLLANLPGWELFSQGPWDWPAHQVQNAFILSVHCPRETARSSMSALETVSVLAVEPLVEPLGIFQQGGGRLGVVGVPESAVGGI